MICDDMNSRLKTHSLESLRTAYVNKDLRVNADYQRGLQWTLTQKQGLIDSLLRGYQIPIFYIHIEKRQNERVPRRLYYRNGLRWRESDARSGKKDFAKGRMTPGGREPSLREHRHH